MGPAMLLKIGSYLVQASVHYAPKVCDDIVRIFEACDQTPYADSDCHNCQHADGGCDCC